MCTIGTRKISVGDGGGNASKASHMRASEMVFWNKGWTSIFLWVHEQLEIVFCVFPGRLHGPKLLTESF